MFDWGGWGLEGGREKHSKQVHVIPAKRAHSDDLKGRQLSQLLNPTTRTLAVRGDPSIWTPRN